MTSELGFSLAENKPLLMEKKSSTNSKYRKIGTIGNGAYGVVYHARKETPEGGEEVVIKLNFVSSREINTISSIRELDMLNLVKTHPFCIQLKEVLYELPFPEKDIVPPAKLAADSVCFVLEKGNCDCYNYIKASNNFFINEKKKLITQLLLGVEFIHSRGIYHCDLKPSNIICFFAVDKSLDSAKLSDFGLSQYYSSQDLNIQEVATLYYRAPEISLGLNYNFKIDIWSLGCIIFELFSNGSRKFIAPESNSELINLLIKNLEFPKDYYFIAKKLYGRKITKTYNRLQNSLKSIASQLNYTDSQIAQFNSKEINMKPNFGTFSELVDLLEHMLVVDPERRWSASQCLNHSFFDGIRSLIRKTRAKFRINTEGEWVTFPKPCLLYRPGEIRTQGMIWFKLIYQNRHSAPVNMWYTPRIFFHGIEIFDRFLRLSATANLNQSELKIWVNLSLFISAKYFDLYIGKFSRNYFSFGFSYDEYQWFETNLLELEKYLIRDLFNNKIYEPTLYELSDGFLTDKVIARMLELIFSENFPSGTSLRFIWASYYTCFYQA